MTEIEREQSRQWLEQLAASLSAWRLVMVGGHDLFAGVMVWTYPGAMSRAASLADLQALLAPSAQGAADDTTTPIPSSGSSASPAGALAPMPQQILPVASSPPGSLDLEQDSLFFLLSDDLPDGELEEALELVQALVPLARRRLLTVLPDSSERQRLQALQGAGVDGICTLGSCGQGRIYTALDAIASGGSYLDPLFRDRLTQADDEGGGVIGPEDLSAQERRLLRDVCRGYNSPEIAQRQGLAAHSVRRQLSHAYQRIGVRDRAQAIGWCVAHGVISAADLQQLYLNRSRGQKSAGHGPVGPSRAAVGSA